MTLRRATRAAVLLAVAASAGVAHADRVVPKKGPAVRGWVTRSDTEVVVNRYRARSAAMTYGVVRFPVADVRRVEEEPDPLETVRRRHDDLAPDDVDGRVGLARFARAQKLPLEADRLLEEALRLKPDHAEAVALYGEARLTSARRGRIEADPAARRAVEEVLALEPGPRRAEAARAVEKGGGPAARPELYERARRSRGEPKGYREDVPLVFAADRCPGAVATWFVPEDYDPLAPRALLLALHDGSKAGKDGTAVVGSGRDAATIYRDAARQRGWILVCPTALAAPWTAPANEPLLLALLDEACARYAVDLDRIYVAGHGMGADGAAAFAARRLDTVAAVAASSGTSVRLPKAVKAAGTRVFLFHGEDDPISAVEATRAAADELLTADADVVYLELPGTGHSFPSEALREMADVLRTARLASARRASAWPRSSFLRRPSADEVRALGDPAAAWGDAK